MTIKQKIKIRLMERRLTRLQREILLLKQQETPKNKIKILKQAADILKRKIKEDPVLWQRNIRSTWS